MFAKIWRLKWFVLLVALLAGGAWYWWTHIREPDWRSAAIEDVDFIRDTIAEDHPGINDPANPEFQARLDAAYAQASLLARQVDGPGGYFYATRAMTSAFDDAHLATQYTRSIPRERRYPGFFIAQSEDGGMRVAQSDLDGAPPVGAQLMACDGQSANDLYDTRIEPFTHMSWLSGKRGANAPWILIDSGNPFVAPPAQCDFLLPGASEAASFDLSWQPLADDVRQAFFDGIAPRVSQQTRLTFPAEGVAWVSIASFFDSGEEVSEDLARLIKSIEKSHGRIAAADTLVIDVRGNLGGASAAGYAVASALWGEEFIAPRLPFFEATHWRASDANLDRLDDAILPLQLRFGSDSELYRKVVAIRDGLQTAHAANEPYFIQPNPIAALTEAAPRALPGTIYLLTDSDCVSACLDFADLVLSLPNVTQIGHETSGDTHYLEVVGIDLPSGLGQLIYPTAIHRGRERGINESYVPALRFDGNIADQDAILWWLSNLPAAGPEKIAS